MHARGSVERRSRKTRETRAAPSVTRVVICVSRAFCSTDQEKRETARSLDPLALASPFVCCSRVTSCDFPKWRACSQATTPQYFYNNWIGAALNFKGLTSGGIIPGRTSFIGLHLFLNFTYSLGAPVYVKFLTCAKRLTQMHGIMIEHLLRCIYRE